MKKTLLISGCSYGVVYSEIADELKALFEVEEVVNLSDYGASPERQIRVVIEWIAQNGKPSMVICPVSHFNRFDLPIANKFDDLHNLHYKSNFSEDWIKKGYRRNEITDVFDRSTLEQYVKLGTLVNQIEHTVHDSLFVRLITFQAFLEINKIKHLIFDTGNFYKKNWMQYLKIDEENNSGYQPGMRKRDLIENCKGIYRFLDFCSNVWMYEQIKNKENHYIEFNQAYLEPNLPNTEQALIHHNKEETLKLVEFLKKENNL